MYQTNARENLASNYGFSYVVEPGLKPPTTPHADDDEFYAPNGTTNVTGRGWSWGNQTGVTSVIVGGRLVLNGTASSSRSYHCLLKSFPSSVDVTVSTRVSLGASSHNWAIGLVFLWGTLATPTHLEIVYLIQEQSSDRRIFWTYGSNYTTGTANRGSVIADRFGLPAYLHMKWDNTASSVRGYYANSPVHDDDWVPVAAAATTPFSGAPDYYGFNLTDLTVSPSGAFLQGSADFFRVDWTPDFDPTLHS